MAAGRDDPGSQHCSGILSGLVMEGGVDRWDEIQPFAWCRPMRRFGHHSSEVCCCYHYYQWPGNHPMNYWLP